MPSQWAWVAGGGGGFRRLFGGGGGGGGEGVRGFRGVLAGLGGFEAFCSPALRFRGQRVKFIVSGRHTVYL